MDALCSKVGTTGIEEEERGGGEEDDDDLVM
jgi:hypothetical protein